MARLVPIYISVTLIEFTLPTGNHSGDTDQFLSGDVDQIGNGTSITYGDIDRASGHELHQRHRKGDVTGRVASWEDVFDQRHQRGLRKLQELWKNEKNVFP